jgi:thioredoxin 1
MKKGIFILVVAVLWNGCSQGQKEKEDVRVSALEFSEKIKAGKAEGVLLIDVRTPAEYKKGHIGGAVNIDLNGSDFEDKISDLDKSKPVYVYCLSGARSSRAAGIMRSSGFKNVMEIPGGMMEWRAGGFPEQKGIPVAGGMSPEEYYDLLQTDKLVLIDFYADWCAPCKKMEPYLQKIADELTDKVTVIRIDADENPELCGALQVSSLPLLKLYENRELVWENIGYIEEEEVRKRLSQRLE